MAAANTPPDAATIPATISAPGKAGGSMLPLVAVIVLVPALCFGVTELLLVPRLKASIGAQEESGTSGAKADSNGKKQPAKRGKPGEHTSEFGATIVNLTGTGGSRYLRTNFFIASSDPMIDDIIKRNETSLRDVAIGVLSGQSLAGLDAPGGRNLVRNELITQFNRTLGGEVVEQIYFSEFVVQ